MGARYYQLVIDNYLLCDINETYLLQVESAGIVPI